MKALMMKAIEVLGYGIAIMVIIIFIVMIVAFTSGAVTGYAIHEEKRECNGTEILNGKGCVEEYIILPGETGEEQKVKSNSLKPKNI